MNTMSKAFTVLAGSVALSFILPASADNGIQFYEFDFPDGTQYIDCLSEEVDIYQSVIGRYHEFTTKTGTYHLVDSWRSTVMWEGVSTGRKWVGLNQNPYVQNISPGETFQWTFTGVQKPIEGDGPRFFYSADYKLTVNANGDTVVEREPQEPFSDRVRCLGKN